MLIDERFCRRHHQNLAPAGTKAHGGDEESNGGLTESRGQNDESIVFGCVHGNGYLILSLFKTPRSDERMSYVFYAAVVVPVIRLVFSRVFRRLLRHVAAVPVMPAVLHCRTHCRTALPLRIVTIKLNLF